MSGKLPAAVAAVTAVAYAAFSVFVWLTDRSVASAAVSDVIVVTGLEAEYARANAGLFEGKLACLETRRTCIPGHYADGFEFTAPPGTSLSAERADRLFVAGLPATNEAQVGRISPSSVRSFAYIAIPSRTRPWWMKLALAPRPRAFCGDATGTVCVGTNIDGGQAKCPEDCAPLN